ncbi:MAG: ASPIC/UnbV domain-containing protein [Planctomycetales bacterium]|nr:ASPIC/UnbV domain-containing protein [Planctomycetales bacterium]
MEPGASLGDFWNEYAEPNLFFRGTKDGRFENISPSTGAFCSRVEVSRSLALGDLDRDGDVDCVVTNVDNMLRIFLNDAPQAGSHWLQVRARVHGRDAIGADIELVAENTPQAKSWRRPLIGTYSYASGNELATHFGLGTVDQVALARVRWPDGTREQFDVGSVDCVVTLQAGTGTMLTGKDHE